MAHPLGYGHDVSPVYTQMPGAKKLPQAMRPQVHPQSLNGAEKIKKTNADSNKKIEELKSSLLQRAFKGEL